MKTRYTNKATRVRRLVLCVLGLMTLGACAIGTAVNPVTPPASVKSNVAVIASWASGNVLDRRVLDANGGFSVDQWPYTQALGQQWRIVPQPDGSSLLMNLASGKAMLATDANAAMQEADVSGDANLHWKVTYQADGHLAEITHNVTGLCLQAASGGASVGSAVHVAACVGSPAQTWVVQPLASAAVSKVVFEVVDNGSGNLLRATYRGTLELGAGDGTQYEQWQLTTNDDGTVAVKNLATGQSLQGVGSTDSLAAPATAPAAAGQTWRLSGPSTNAYALMSATDGTCMVPADASSVTQGPCGSSQGWTLTTSAMAPAPTTSPNTTSSPNNTTSPNTTSIVMPWDANGPTIDDIRQGTANDCWVLAALSTVVYADPNFITKHIIANADGTYTVTIYDGGGTPWTHTTRVIASNVPYTPNPTLTLASQRTGSQGQPIFWPSLYEQAFLAYAQANPGIFRTVDDQYLDTGSEVTAYQYITGDSWYYTDYVAPTDPNNDTFWTNLTYANSAIPVSVLSRSPTGPSDMFDDGVLGDHFYAVLNTSGTGDARTITVRNPWGPRAPNVSDATNLGDGEITMSYTNFVQYFYEIQRALNTSSPP